MAKMKTKEKANPTSKEQGRRITELRKKTHLSGRAFAIKHDIAPGTLRNWENGRYQGLGQKAIDQLLEAFLAESIDVSAEWLLHGKGTPPHIGSKITPLHGTKAAALEFPTASLLPPELIKLTEQNAKKHKINKQLYEATATGRFSEVVKLIEQGADLHLQSGIKIHLHDNNENTPLHVSARNGNFNMVQFLVEHGSKVDIRNRRKQTPLHWAAHNGHTFIAEYLIKKGANIDAVEDEGGSPLSWAAYIGQLDIAKLLINHGANIHSADMDSNTPLHWACYHGHTHMIAFLIDQGANLNKKNSRGMTSLDIAIENGHLETVLLLFDKLNIKC